MSRRPLKSTIETLLKIKLIETQRVWTLNTRYQETYCLETEIATNQIEPFISETFPKARL